MNHGSIFSASTAVLMVIPAFTIQNLLFYLFYFKPMDQIWPQLKLHAFIQEQVVPLQIVNEYSQAERQSNILTFDFLYFSVCEHQ